ncbi:MAG: M14 family metallopeptidase [Caulobacteraceae bacterium]|nr:M14 family metallopeptidase [Caulobacteraceae bacterium]
MKKFLLSTAGAVALCLSIPLASATAGPITSPREQLGHDLGEDYYLADYAQLTAYWKKLASQSDRAKLVDIGATSEGRRQYMMIVSSPENLAKLDHYRDIAKRLALAEGLTDDQAHALAAEGKSVIWIDGGLHANETEPAQALMQAVYDMLSRDDAETRRILDNVIILFGQANPDGQDFVADWYMRNPDPLKRDSGGFGDSTLPHLFQKYVGHDNNRDSYMSAMKETTNLNRIFFREWFPQIIYNHHQTGPQGAVVFVPPFRDPFNYNYDPLVMTELNEVSGEMHSRLIAEGKPGSAMRSAATYSTWNNGMERTVAYFHNTIGILTEIIGSPTPFSLPLVPDNQLPRNDLPMPIKPQTWHLKQSVDYSVSMNRAVLDYAANNRERLMFNIYRMGANAIQRGGQDSWTITSDRIDALKAADKATPDAVRAAALAASGAPAFRAVGLADPKLYDTVLHDPAQRDPRGYILPADQADFPTAIKFLNALIKNGVAVDRATTTFTVGGKTYPAGSYVVRTAQAYRPHILDMFEPQRHPNNFAYPGGPPIPPYDAAGYTLAFQMGVKFDRVLDGFDGPFEKVPDLIKPPAGHVLGEGGAGFLVSHEVNDSVILTNRLLKAGQPVYWLKPSVTVDGQTYAPGAIWVPASAKARAILEAGGAELGIDIRAVKAAPAADRIKLKPVRVGVVDIYGGLMSGGWTQYLMEQFEIPYTVVRPQRLDAGNLGRDFDVLVFPDSAISEAGGFSGGMFRGAASMGAPQPKPEAIPAEYRGWLGTITREKTGPQIERFVRDGGSVVSVGSSTALASFLKLPVESGTAEVVDGKVQPLPRTKFYIPGSVLSAKVDNTDPLAFGEPDTVDMFFDQSPVFKVADGPGLHRVAWFSGAHPLRSGWAWGQERLDGTTAVIDADLGKGKVFLMGPEITMRAQPHGTFKFLFNALYYGPAVSKP